MAKKPAKKAAKTAKPKAKVNTKAKVAAKAPVKKAAPKAAKKAPAKPVKKATAAKPAAKKPVKKAVTKTVAKKAAPAKPVAKAAKPVAKNVVKKQEKTKAPVAKPITKATNTKAPVVKNVTKNEVVKEKEVKKAVTKTVAPKPEPKKEAPVVKTPPRKFERQLKPKPAIVSLNTDNRSRYSDAELAEFRELITGKLETSRGELKYLQEQISRSSEMGDDSDARFKGLEDGTSTSEREYLSQMASRQIQYIGHLEKALIRIENKTYGICRETGKLISKERLRAVPHATLSIEAKQGKG